MEPINTEEKKPLKKTVIQEIKHYIISQNLKAGDQLPTERKFTEMFGVSRSVVREALSYLENTDVIRIRQGQGAFLNESNIENLLDNFFFLWQINSGNIRDILGLRIIFESSAIDEIIKHHKMDELTRLKEIVEESENATTQDECKEADTLFHKQLLQATNNDLFIQMTNMITSYFFQIQHHNITREEYQLIINEHKNIVEALLNGNGEQAKTLLINHIRQTKV